MPTAYLFIHLRAHTSYKPNLTIHQPAHGTTAPPASDTEWTKITGTLPSAPPQPDRTVTLYVAAKKGRVHDCAGPFSAYSDADKAAEGRCLDFLSEKCIAQARVDISWKPRVDQQRSHKETTYARTYGSGHYVKDWWDVVEVDIHV